MSVTMSETETLPDRLLWYYLLTGAILGTLFLIGFLIYQFT